MTTNSETISKTRVNSGQEERGWGSLGAAVYIKICIIGVLVYYLFREDINLIVYRWVNDSSWSHGFLIPLFSLYFLNQHKDKILEIKAKQNWLGLISLLLLLVFYPLNYKYFRVGYARPITVIACLGSIVLFLGGWKLVRYTWLPVVYLIFAIPLPGRWYKMITIPMRQWAAQIATVLLSLVKDLEASVQGVIINVIYKGIPLDQPLDVAEACSGMRLLMAFLALGVAMAYLHWRPVWQRIVLVCSTIPIAIFCNIIRVTVTGFIHILWDPKYAQGIYHDMLGMMMLPLAFGIYGTLAWFMSNLFVEDKVSTDVDVIIRRKSS